MLCSTGFAQDRTVVRLSTDEFTFSPAKIQVARGSVTITTTNRGNFPHGLAFVGRSEKIDFIDSGETKSITLVFEKAGKLEFYCPQPGHCGKGMAGSVTITQN